MQLRTSSIEAMYRASWSNKSLPVTVVISTISEHEEKTTTTRNPNYERVVVCVRMYVCVGAELRECECV